MRMRETGKERKKQEGKKNYQEKMKVQFVVIMPFRQKYLRFFFIGPCDVPFTSSFFFTQLIYIINR